jgi:hypothetical protein
VFRDALPAAREVARIMTAVPGMTIDRQRRRRRFQVVGSAGSISAASDSFAVRGSTQIRSHLVSFNLMANTREQLDFLRRSLDKIAYAGDSPAESPDPVCIDNYVKDDPSADSV